MTPPAPARALMLAPMRPELDPLVKALALRRRTARGDDPVFEGGLGPTRVTATITGIGPEAAARATRRALELGPVDHVIVVGIAGGLAPTLRIADVVVPEVVVARETGAQYRPAPIPAGDAAVGGKLLTTGELITEPHSLADLVRHGYVAVDMETASVAAVCEQHGLPWSVIRAVSDRPADGTLDASVLDLTYPDGTPRWGAVARHLARHPRRIVPLARLARDARAATRAAARAAAYASKSGVG